MVFDPYVEGLDTLKTPPGLINEFKSLSSGIYPSETLAKLRKDGYNPFIIGYIHNGDEKRFLNVTKRFKQVAALISGKPKVALEIDPEQLGWIKEFLGDEKDFKKLGTIRGKKPSAEEISRLLGYRSKLHQSHSGRLALWLLENKFSVISIEHKEVMSWVNSDRRMFSYDEKSWQAPYLPSFFQPAYTAIRRDIYGIEVIDKERPAIISVGGYHALKYDLLLGRDGKKSYYFLTRDFSWSKSLNMWRQVHNFYLQQKAATK